MKYSEWKRGYDKGTVADLIERFIKDMAGAEMKPLGRTHMGILRKLQTYDIGKMQARALKKSDIIEHCRWRRKTVGPATANHDVVFLGGVLKYASAAWDDCLDLSQSVVKDARPFLTKHNLIGKANIRKRVPTDEEVAALMAYFEEHDKHPKAKIKMCNVVAFALASTRRRGEICRIRRSDIDWERGTYMVRDVKNPRGSTGNHKTFPLFPELIEIIKRQPAVEGDDRVFPFDSNSVGAAYCVAKKALGIEGLRFHDCRRSAITHWLKTLPPHKVRQISGHETTVILERVYAAPKAEDLLREVAEQRQQVAA